MVYCGKPSRGCQCCKTRRIKCDEARPHCGNCKKSGRQCPGYPDEFDLIFRNETSATKKRAQKTSNRQRSTTSASRSPTSTQSEESISPKSPKLSPAIIQDSTDPAILESTEAIINDFYNVEISDQSQLAVSSLFERAVTDPKFPFFDISCSPSSFWGTSSIPAGLEYSVDAAATQFFFRNFVYLPQENGSCRGYLEYLIPMYNKTTSDSAVHLATHAVSLSALGNYPGNSRLKVDARKAYGKALNKVNELIQDPVKGSSNETLMAILMFSLYEAVTPTAEADTAWSNHVDGAVALAKRRGGDDWTTTESVGLFRAIRMCMLTNSIQHSKPVDDFPGSKGWLCDDTHFPNPANRLAMISLGLPNLRHYTLDVVSQTPGPQKDAEILNLIHMAQEVDGQLEHWYLTLPEEWGHRTVAMQLEEPEDLAKAPQWQGPVHVYGDIFLANIVNDYRVSRIFCQKVILTASAALSDPETLLSVHGMQQQALYNARKMADDVCSSVPYHLEINLQDNAKDSGQEVHAAEATGGYFLTWPLFVLSSTDCIPLRQREWIHGRLCKIGQDFGLGPAQIQTMAQRQVLTSGPSFP